MTGFGIGQGVRRGEDRRFLSGRGRFVDDIRLPGMVHAVVVYSSHAHGRILAVDTAAAPMRNFPTPYRGYAMTGMFVAERDGVPYVAVTGAGPFVFRSALHEAALAVRMTPEAARDVVVPAADIISDFDAPAVYRAHLISVMAARAVRAILGPVSP